MNVFEDEENKYLKMEKLNKIYVWRRKRWIGNKINYLNYLKIDNLI